MAKKVLQVVECAYRGTIEEQDDTVVWITHAMKGAGGDLDVLIRGNAVNHAVKGQDASGLQFGTWNQTQPPTLDGDIAKLIGKGIQVHVVQEDVGRLGLEITDLVDGVKPIPQTGVAALFSDYDQIWHW
jgi:intracellular sulfur oxidation DsrE/DsrF family protein